MSGGTACTKFLWFGNYFVNEETGKLYLLRTRDTEITQFIQILYYFQVYVASMRFELRTKWIDISSLFAYV